MLPEVAADIRGIFQAPNRHQAEVYLKQVVTKYADSASDLADWLEVSIPEGLTVFDFPSGHWRRIRTSNLMERLSQEIKRRTRVIRLFPNVASCLRLVSAVLMERSEDWETGKMYLNLDTV